MDAILIAVAAFVGGLIAALLGWCESGEAFQPRKFGGSLIRSLVAAIVFAVGYQALGETLTVLDLFYGFLGGAGVDVLANRLTGVLGNPSFPLPKG